VLVSFQASISGLQLLNNNEYDAARGKIKQTK